MSAYAGSSKNRKDLKDVFCRARLGARGLAVQFPVSAYIGCSKNLKDLKGKSLRSSYTELCPQKRLGGVEMESRLGADPRDPLLRSERTQDFAAGPVYGRARCLPMLGEIKN